MLKFYRKLMQTDIVEMITDGNQHFYEKLNLPE